jgi:hypothetical protein
VVAPGGGFGEAWWSWRHQLCWRVARPAGAGCHPTPVPFAGAIAVLAVLTAMIAALPPAVYAANVDPVRIMRTP